MWWGQGSGNIEPTTRHFDIFSPLLSCSHIPVYMQFNFNLPDITTFISQCPTRLAVSTPLGKVFVLSVLQLHSLVYYSVTYLNTCNCYFWVTFMTIFTSIIVRANIHLYWYSIYYLYTCMCMLNANWNWINERCNMSLRYHVSWSVWTDKENSIHDYAIVHTTVYNNIDVLFMVWNGLYFSYHTKRWNTRSIYTRQKIIIRWASLSKQEWHWLNRRIQ